MNSFTAIGNLASDVDLREFDKDGEKRNVASFLLAINRPGKDAGADFVRVTAWNGTAKSCSEYLSKGKKVGITGRLTSSRYEKDGVTIDKVEITAQRVEFLSPNPNGTGVQAEQPTQGTAAPSTDDDIPF
jgi:single-strand DNA-binding protein